MASHDTAKRITKKIHEYNLVRINQQHTLKEYFMDVDIT